MGVPGVRQRTRLEVARDRALITRLKLLNGLHNILIAERVNEQYANLPVDDKGRKPPRITAETVKKELQAAKSDASKEVVTVVTEQRAEAIRGYRQFINYLMERYEASCSGKVVSTVEEKEGESDKGANTSVTRKTVKENKDGDARYLELVERCKWRIAELQAIIPPKKVAPTNPEGTEAFKFEGAEEFKRLESLARELLVIPRTE